MKRPPANAVEVFSGLSRRAPTDVLPVQGGLDLVCCGQYLVCVSLVSGNPYDADACYRLVSLRCRSGGYTTLDVAPNSLSISATTWSADTRPVRRRASWLSDAGGGVSVSGFRCGGGFRSTVSASADRAARTTANGLLSTAP